MNLDVSHQELLPHPVDKIWAALTDHASISDWLMATDDFRPAVGVQIPHENAATHRAHRRRLQRELRRRQHGPDGGHS